LLAPNVKAYPITANVVLFNNQLAHLGLPAHLEKLETPDTLAALAVLAMLDLKATVGAV